MEIEIIVTEDSGKRFRGTAILSPEGVSAGRKAQAVKPRAAKTARNSLPGQILALRDGGFFREWRTGVEVHNKLAEKYHCERNRVDVALLRLQERRELRKGSKLVGGKRQVAYAW